MDVERTRLYYEQLGRCDVCDCVYCKNYISEIKKTYPEAAEYLLSMGIDIEKPFETMPLELDKTGYIDYIAAQYIVYGKPDGFEKTAIGSINVGIAESHPSTEINEDHFVVEIWPVRLKWVM